MMYLYQVKFCLHKDNVNVGCKLSKTITIIIMMTDGKAKQFWKYVGII